jgi:hypothetical protein
LKDDATAIYAGTLAGTKEFKRVNRQQGSKAHSLKASDAKADPNKEQNGFDMAMEFALKNKSVIVKAVETGAKV